MPNPKFKRARSSAERDIKALLEKVDKIDMPKLWFQKRKRIFKILDPKETGIASRDGLEVFAQRFKQHSEATPERWMEIQNHLQGFWDDIFKGSGDTMTFKDFCKLDYVLLTVPDLKEDLDTFTKDLGTQMFDIIDSNGDGIISRPEWKVWFKCMDVFDEKEADLAFDTIDLNKDGSMSREEFAIGFREFGTTAESNKYDFFCGPLSEV